MKSEGWSLFALGPPDVPHAFLGSALLYSRPLWSFGLNFCVRRMTDSNTPGGRAASEASDQTKTREPYAEAHRQPPGMVEERAPASVLENRDQIGRGGCGSVRRGRPTFPTRRCTARGLPTRPLWLQAHAPALTPEGPQATPDGRAAREASGQTRPKAVRRQRHRTPGGRAASEASGQTRPQGPVRRQRAATPRWLRSERSERTDETTARRRRPRCRTCEGGRAASDPPPVWSSSDRTPRWSSSERSERTDETRAVRRAGPQPRGGRAARAASGQTRPGAVRRARTATPRWSSSERASGETRPLFRLDAHEVG